nr:MiaB/RimO family radical SAM methylthiotransferase [bacterium]
MRFIVHALGCKVNQYDAAAAQAAMEQAGHTLAQPGQKPDVAIVFTCTVTAEAQRKSLQAVRRAAREVGCVVAAGCTAQRVGRQLLDIPGVVLVVGSSRRAQIPALLSRALAEGPICAVEGLENPACTWEETPVLTPYDGRARAHVKVQEGCSRKCGYCAVPLARGPERSRPLELIAQECQRLARQGISEVILVGINLASYGKGQGLTLVDAVSCAAQNGIKRVRLGSLEPDLVTPGMIEGFLRIPQLCPQFHLPLQTGSEKVNAAMGRICTPGRVAQTAAALRQAFPNCGLWTDVMVGFPGEGEAEFMQTMSLCREIGFTRLHVFPFSPRPDTRAEKMPGRPEAGEVRRRVGELMQEGERLRQAYEAGFIGQKAQVLFETKADGVTIGHTPQGIVAFVPGGKPGQMAECMLKGVHAQGLYADMI